MVDYFAVLMNLIVLCFLIPDMKSYTSFGVHTSDRENFSTMCEKGYISVVKVPDGSNVCVYVQYRAVRN